MAAVAAGFGNRVVHDPADSSRAAAALGATPEATIDLTRTARRLLGVECNAHVVVTQHVARTDDHGDPTIQNAAVLNGERNFPRGNNARALIPDQPGF